MTEGQFLSVSDIVGLVLSSDGVPVFKSSKGSLWPVYLMVTSIPPHKRAKVENLLIAALWHGHVKQKMDVLLQPILDNIADLSRRGINAGSNSAIRPKLLIGVFDLPAKSSVTNTKQFNGENGCLYCLEKGVVHNRARIYPPTHTALQLRTTTEMALGHWKQKEVVKQSME